MRRATRWRAALGIAAALSLGAGCDAFGGATGDALFGQDSTSGPDVPIDAPAETSVDTGPGPSDAGADPGPVAIPATFTSLYGSYLHGCSYCHAPDGPGRVAGIEATLDLSTRALAYQTITAGAASGLVGNQEACNGVPFIGASAATSLLMAVLDEQTRQAFDLQDPEHLLCDLDAISDMALKLGEDPPTGYLAALATWIDTGAPDD